MLENLRDRIRGGSREKWVEDTEKARENKNKLELLKKREEEINTENKIIKSEARLKRYEVEHSPFGMFQKRASSFGKDLSIGKSQFGKKKETWNSSFGGSFAGVRKIEGKRYDSTDKKKRRR